MTTIQSITTAITSLYEQDFYLWLQTTINLLKEGKFAEIVSPTDIAEDVFLKAQEYLESSCQEVWLVFPESRLIFVMTPNQILTFRAGETASTQQILLGFSIEVDRLLA